MRKNGLAARPVMNRTIQTVSFLLGYFPQNQTHRNIIRLQTQQLSVKRWVGKKIESAKRPIRRSCKHRLYMSISSNEPLCRLIYAYGLHSHLLLSVRRGLMIVITFIVFLTCDNRLNTGRLYTYLGSRKTSEFAEAIRTVDDGVSRSLGISQHEIAVCKQ